MASKITEGSIAMLLERHKSVGMLNRETFRKDDRATQKYSIYFILYRATKKVFHAGTNKIPIDTI